MKKYDILAIGELNVDLLLNKIGGFPEVGKEIFAKDMTLALGSSTAIFAANAASLGAKVSFLGMIGKGGRKGDVPELIRKYKAVYFAAPGGCGALLGKSIIECEIIAYPDLGTEAVRKLTVVDFPAFVAQDSLGNSIY